MLASNDMAGDIIANHLNASGVATKRVYRGSYYALIDLYKRQRGRRAHPSVRLAQSTRTTLRSFQVFAAGAPVTIIRPVPTPHGICRKGRQSASHHDVGRPAE